MVWGVDGMMNGVWNAAAKIKAIDFAGGTVVHMSSGWSALVLCLILGKRKGFGAASLPAAQPGADDGRHRHAVGRLVRLQRRQRGRRRRHRRQRVHDHDPRHRRRRAACGRCSSGSPAASRRSSASAPARSPAWSSITPASGLRERDGRGHHRRARRRGAVPGLHQAEGDVRVRRRAGHLRRSRRRRHHGRARDRLPRHRGREREPQHQPRATSSATACGSSSSRPWASRWCWRSAARSSSP